MFQWILRRAADETKRADASPQLAQARVLQALARTVANTKIAALQNPKIFADLDAFKAHIKLTRAEHIGPIVAAAMQTKTKGAFEAGVTNAFAFSSSGIKYTPYTRAHVAMFRKFSLALLAQAVIELGMTELATGRMMMWQLPLGVGRCESGASAGYSTAIMVEKMPWLIKQRLTPSIKALEGPLGPRLDAIAHAFVTKKPQAITSIPENLAGYIGLLMERADAAQIRESLYTLRAYAWGGSTFAPYDSLVGEFFRPDIKLYDAISATEGPLGFGCERGVYRLAWNQAVHLLHKDGALFWPWETERGETYDVVTSSFCGLLGYLGGDRITVLATQPFRFALAPRPTALVRDALGKVWDHAFVKDENLLYLESEHAPTEEALAKLGSPRVVRLPRFTVSKAFVKAQRRELPKLPRNATRAQMDLFLV